MFWVYVEVAEVMFRAQKCFFVGTKFFKLFERTKWNNFLNHSEFLMGGNQIRDTSHAEHYRSGPQSSFNLPISEFTYFNIYS